MMTSSNKKLSRNKSNTQESITPVYDLKTSDIKKFTRQFANHLKNSDLSRKEIWSAARVLESVLCNPFEKSATIYQKLKITEDQLKRCYLIIQQSRAAQKILQLSFPRHYTLFRDRILSDDIWKKVFAGENPFPTEIEIHPSEVCNINCQFCPTAGHDYKNQDYYSEMKRKVVNQKWIVEKMQNIFFEVAPGNTKRILFSGGKEPTFSPLILELINAAKKAGLYTKVTTNGSGFMISHKCDDKIIQGEELFKFYASNLNRIHLSLNAHNRKLFNKMKGLKKGARVFDQIVLNIKRIVEWRDKLRKDGKSSVEIYAAVLVDRENHKLIPNIVKFLTKLGVDIISINRYQYQMVRKEDVFNDKEIEVLLKKLEQIKRKWKSKKTQLIVSIEDFRNTYYKHVLSLNTRCWIACCEMGINPVFLSLVCDTATFPGREIFGNVDFKLGNLLEYPNFKSFWDNTFIKRKNVLTEQCPDCRFCHKVINAYVEKLYVDYRNGFAIKEQPFYSFI